MFGGLGPQEGPTGMLASITFAILLASAPQAAEPPPSPDRPADAEVTITATPGDAIRAFVDALGEETKKGKLARWDRTLCPAVIGLPQKYGTYIADRIGQTIVDVGLSVDPGPCRPDVLILITPQPDEAAARLVKEQAVAMALRPRQNRNATGGGSQSQEDFVNSDAAVRWWHAAETVPADGSGYAADGKTFNAYSASRLKSNLAERFTQVIIVVDGRQLRGVTYDQLAAYLSMVALAQLPSGVSPEGRDSILRLFEAVQAGETAPDGLTKWDLAYLKALYASPADARDGQAQRASIVRDVERAATDPVPARR